jgi:uncharacterized repeat protein (TIGR03803 family)
MRLRALRLVALVATSVAAIVTAPGDARAVGTRTFELDSLEKLSGGDLKGVSVGSDGFVRAGWTLGNVPLPSDAGTTATCAIGLADGGVLVGTGPSSGGKVVRIANDRATVFADTKENAVNALAVDKAGTVYAATTSNKIYRVTQGKADVFATLADVDSVFALVIDRTGALYAGTGSDGKVVRVQPGAASTVYFKTDEPFVVSLAAGDDGTIYAGTSGSGLLYRITAAGRATVLYDFPGEDVHAVAVGPDRTVWAIANEEQSGSSSESSESSSSKRSGGGRAAPGPTPSGARSKPGKGSLWRFDAQGRPERVMHHDDFHYVSLALDSRGVPYVGTGAEGRVYTVDDAHRTSLVADTDERQVGAILAGTRTPFVIGSDPATLHRVLAVGGPDAVWTSKSLDAGLRARFGHLTWQGTGALEVSTRSGDTQTPDATWSAWSAPVAQGGVATTPAGRFLQVRARLRDATSTIGNITLPFVTENLRAVVTEVAAHQKGAPHEQKEGIAASGSEPPKHDSVVHVTWKTDNPDNDELRYRVQFRREGATRWIEATRPDEALTKSEFDWDTASLPEGKYRVRIDASDELSNPPADATHHALETAPVLVDNTPPVFKSLAMQGRRLRAELVDGLGPIARVEVALDGQLLWRPLAPADGIFDTADEMVDADITALIPPGPGPHIVAVRAYDAAGNSAVREVETP